MTLDESASNMEYLEIFYSLDNTDSNNAHFPAYKSVKIYNPGGKKAMLEGITYHDQLAIVQLSWVPITISGVNITRGTERYMNLADDQVPHISTQTKIKIYRVTGM